MCKFHLNMNLSSHCNVISDVINTIYTFYRSFMCDLFIPDVKLKLCRIFCNVQIWRYFKVMANFFIGSFTVSWVRYLDSLEYFRHYEHLIDALIWYWPSYGNFKVLPTFFTLWQSYLTSGLEKTIGIVTQHRIHIWDKFIDDMLKHSWIIILVTHRLTHRQAYHQTNTLAKIANFCKL